MGCIELFNVGDTLGDVVTKFPNAATIFSQSQIDFCCGGARSIQQALDEKNLDASGFMLALNAAWIEQQSQDSVFINWQEAPLTKLVDHILQAHHAYLQQNMPKIGELSTKILRVHGEHHGQVLSILHRQFHLFKMAMEEHLIKEETQVFPRIKAYEETQTVADLRAVNQAITTLEQEHEEAGQLLRTMREITSDYELPSDACKTYALTFQLMKEMEDNTFVHVHLENNILFRRLRQLEVELQADPR